MIINRALVCFLIDSNVRARHFRLPKSTEPILFSQRRAKTASGRERERERKRERGARGNRAGNERRRINLRQTVPSKRGMQMAPGAISNFTIPKVVGATFTAYLACLPASQLLPLHESPLRLPSTFPHRRGVFSRPRPPSVPLKSSRSPSAEIVRTIPRARIPVMFARLLYLNEKRAGVSSRVFSPTPFRSECQRAELIYRASSRCTCDHSEQRRLLIESSAGLLDGIGGHAKLISRENVHTRCYRDKLYIRVDDNTARSSILPAASS